MKDLNISSRPLLYASGASTKPTGFIDPPFSEPTKPRMLQTLLKPEPT